MADVIAKIDSTLDTKCGGAVVNTPFSYQSLPLSTETCTPVTDTEDDMTNRLIKAGSTTMVQSGNINPVIPVHMTNPIDIAGVDVTGGALTITGDVSVSASQPVGLKVDDREMVNLLEQTLAELIKQNIHLESMTDERILDVDIETQGVI